MLHLYLLVDESQAGLFRRRGKKQREVHSIITQQIVPGICSSLSDDYLPEHYPWSFVISSPSSRGHNTYSGAFMLRAGKGGTPSLIIIYGEAPWPWLKENLQDEFPLTFWASRILNHVPDSDVVEKNWRPLWQRVKALRRTYSALWEKLVLTSARQFKNHSQMLLRGGAQEDYRIQNRDGVEAMPWQNWPDCIEQEVGIWIWRQSRHKKIVDSQRIPLRRAEAKPPDASF
ncbi:T6SS protein Cts1T [Enterobacter asburiae]|uniref:T6SS protein Cts1T n=1 Tax=Enterobacter asburiae TaxID=61645 RepID=UPI00287B1678|nr:T6SS protein Cts1T [Enterobacter asburiae]MDS1916269.1 T6SS protein Cts1T [Enterobacter asburiae]